MSKKQQINRAAAGDLKKQGQKEIAIELSLPQGKIQAHLEIPEGPMRLIDLAQDLMGLSSAAAEMAGQGAAMAGRKVACKDRCGACCCQIVPLSPPEAGMIYEITAEISGPLGEEIRGRFKAAAAKLSNSDVMEAISVLLDPLADGSRDNEAARAYFDLKLPCPFLINESCAIYERRPSMCREYLVVSESENCEDPFRNPVKRLPVFIRLSEALARLWAAMTKSSPILIPLALAPAWVESHKKSVYIGANPQAMTDLFMSYISTNDPDSRLRGHGD